MSSATKKKTGVKDRGTTEGTAIVVSVQSAFTSAARATVWHADTPLFTSSIFSAPAVHSAASVTAAAADITSPRLPTASHAYTAAANAVCGRPFGAIQMEDPWSQAEVLPCVRDTDKLLPASPAWSSEREVYGRLFTSAPAAVRSPAASSPPVAAIDSSNNFSPQRLADLMYEEWLTHVAVHRSTQVLYPHHTLCFDAAPILSASAAAAAATTQSASPYMQVAAVIHRLLTAYLERCSEQHNSTRSVSVAEAERGGVPSRVFASMLYTSVYNNNFSGPAKEQRDVAFNAAGLNQLTSQDVVEPPALPCPRRYGALSVISCLGAAHLCVCVGGRYYKLRVVDEPRGRLKGVASIAASLEAICGHHGDVTSADPLSAISPAVRSDNAAMGAMFAHLSSLDDADAFQVRRRLRDASAVNAYTLDTLESGLCTLVLKGAPGAALKKGKEKEDDDVIDPTARWLHSVCCLEVSLCQPTQWVMRLQAAVVPSQAGVEWIARATAPSVGSVGISAAVATGIPPNESAGVAEERTGGGDGAGSQTAVLHALLRQTALSTPLDDDGGAEYLELWLPEKHRVPLRPYPAPRWNPESTQRALKNISAAGACTLDQFIMSLLQVTVNLKRDNKLFSASTAVRKSVREKAEATADAWPRVVLAVQPVCGGAPTLVALNSPIIQHYYEILAARPLLFARESKARIEAAAREEVRAVVNIAWHAASTVRTRPPDITGTNININTTVTALPSTPSSFPLSWWDTLEKSAADVCVTFSVLPRATSSVSAAAVRRVASDLALPSVLLVNCTAQQTVAETHVRASVARVVNAVVQTNTPASVEFGNAFSDALASCTLN